MDDVSKEIDKAYDFKSLPSDVQAHCDRVRQDFKILAISVSGIPNNRARSLALTNLQQAKMWAVQAIVDSMS